MGSTEGLVCDFDFRCVHGVDREYAWLIMLCQVPEGFSDPLSCLFERRRVAVLKANGLVHLGSHLLKKSKFTSFFLTLKLFC
jgi:hypothetical protein